MVPLSRARCTAHPEGSLYLFRATLVAALALKRHRLTRGSLAARLARVALAGNRPYLKSKSFGTLGGASWAILREKTQVAH